MSRVPDISGINRLEVLLVSCSLEKNVDAWANTPRQEVYCRSYKGALVVAVPSPGSEPNAETSLMRLPGSGSSDHRSSLPKEAAMTLAMMLARIGSL
jgi:hypothetical protein